MATYDAESFLADIEATLKARLPAKLLQISAEKGDGIALPPINDAAYCFQTLNDKVVNYTPFIFYGIVDGNDVGIGPATSSNWVVEVVIAFTDTGQEAVTDPVGKKLLRYRRALQEVFQEHWSKMRNGVKMNVRSLSPVSMQLANSSEQHKVVGVQIEATVS